MIMKHFFHRSSHGKGDTLCKKFGKYSKMLYHYYKVNTSMAASNSTWR